MPYAMILRYSLSALKFALVAAAAWLALRFIRRRDRLGKGDLIRLFTVGYLAALVQIIGLRLGLVSYRPLGGELRLRPFFTALEQWHMGPGRFIYHTVGNLLWFLPLGALLARRRPRVCWRQALLAGAGLSLALEALQLLLGSGVSDVDDILLNALGTLLGYALCAWITGMMRARGSGKGNV